MEVEIEVSIGRRDSETCRIGLARTVKQWNEIHRVRGGAGVSVVGSDIEGGVMRFRVRPNDPCDATACSLFATEYCTALGIARWLNRAIKLVIVAGLVAAAAAVCWLIF